MNENCVSSNERTCSFYQEDCSLFLTVISRLDICSNSHISFSLHYGGLSRNILHIPMKEMVVMRKDGRRESRDVGIMGIFLL